MVFKTMEQNQKPGTYVGVRFSEKTKKTIDKFCKDNKIPNSVPPAKLHTTLLSSEKHLPNYKPRGKLKNPMVGIPKKLDLWGENSNCLVLIYECDDLISRHKHLIDEHNATHIYPDYIPHITLSYDLEDYDVDELRGKLEPIEIIEEYHSDLDNEWVDNNKLNKNNK